LFLCTDVNLLILTAASIVSSAPGHLCTQNRETESVKTSGACALILLVLLLTTWMEGSTLVSLNLVECCCWLEGKIASWAIRV
jgi:hypothetical protein